MTKDPPSSGTKGMGPAERAPVAVPVRSTEQYQLVKLMAQLEDKGISYTDKRYQLLLRLAGAKLYPPPPPPSSTPAPSAPKPAPTSTADVSKPEGANANGTTQPTGQTEPGATPMDTVKTEDGSSVAETNVNPIPSEEQVAKPVLDESEARYAANMTTNLPIRLDAPLKIAQDSTNELFSQERLLRLKAQITAYRLLSRDLSISPQMLLACQGIATPVSAAVVDVVGRSSLGLPRRDDNGKAISYRLGTSQQGSQDYLLESTSSGVRDPSAATSVSKAVYSKPPSQDTDGISEARTRLLDVNLEARAKQLRELLPTLPEEQRTKALIELKGIQLVHLQRATRRSVLEETSRVVVNVRASQKEARKSKRELQKVARQNERLLQQVRNEREQRKRLKHRDFNNSVVAHGKSLKMFYRDQRSLHGRVFKEIRAYPKLKEKRVAEAKQRAERDRIRALKSNDEEAYMRLLAEAKNSRLHAILEQTDSFLENIGAMVQKEREQRNLEREDDKEQLAVLEAERTHLEDLKQQQDAASGDAAESDRLQATLQLLRRKDQYYSIAHRLNEKVTKQPDMLIGGTLKPYQIQGLEWLISLYNNNMNGVLADEMGLGKTIQTISLLTYLLEKKNQKGPWLVIVPLSTMSNWISEFAKWAPGIVTVAYKGTPAVRKNLQMNEIREGYHCLLTTYEYIMKDRNFLSKIKWNHIIIDEGHRMKNHHCKFTQCLTQHFKSAHRLLLTGTPLQNSLPELWSLLNFLLPTVFNSCENFESWFSAPFANTGEKVEVTEEEQLLVIHRLHQVLRPFLLRRLKKEVETQLPDKVERVLKCDLSAWQKKLYNDIQSKGMATRDSNGRVTVKSLSNIMMQLRKVCNHPYLFYASDWMQEPQLASLPARAIMRASGKFELLERMLPKLVASGHKMLIFSQMTRLLDLLEDYLNVIGLKFLRLDGSTKQEDRAERMALFQADGSDYGVFLLSTRAGGLGLNLQKADTVIIFDSDWNPQMDLQAQDRAHRIGQEREVRVFRLCTASPVEEKILQRANYKLDMDAKIIQSGKFNNSAGNDDRYSMLEALIREKAEEDTNQKEVISDKKLNRWLARSPEEEVMFKRMDEQRLERDKQEFNERYPGHVFSRLMQECELPEMVVMEQESRVETEEELLANYGRGNRVRKTVSYNENVSDSKFVKAVESGMDINEYLQKESRKRRREPEPVASRADRRVGRVAKTELDEMANKYLAVVDAVVKAKDETGRLRYEIFDRLPTRRELPQYYQIIKEPMDLERIRNKIKRNKYPSHEDLAKDFRLMWSNARTFNLPTSIIFTDANALEAVFENAYAAIFPSDESSDVEVGEAPPPAPAPAPAPAPSTDAPKISIRLNLGGQ